MSTLKWLVIAALIYINIVFIQLPVWLVIFGLVLAFITSSIEDSKKKLIFLRTSARRRSLNKRL